MLLQKGNTGSSMRGWSIFIENGRLIIRVNASNDAIQRTSTSVALMVGARTDHVYYYLGMADDLRLYNRALTLDEIAVLAQNHRQ